MNQVGENVDKHDISEGVESNWKSLEKKRLGMMM